MGSPRSVASDDGGSPAPELDPSTLAILQQFQQEQKEVAEQFQALAERAERDYAAHSDKQQQRKEWMSVDEFRKLFGEDWQLSQFWYSSEFATQLAKLVRSHCSADSTVAWISCPTGYVAFQHTNALDNARLLEVDDRFHFCAGDAYVHYDLDEPEAVPADLVGKVDLVVADPPFLNEATNRKLAKTLALLLKPDTGKLVLLTSTSVEHLLPSIYDKPPYGPLKRQPVEVHHANNLSNDFALYASFDLVKP